MSDQLRAKGRAAIGVTGVDSAPGFRRAVQAGSGLPVLAALGCLAGVGTFMFFGAFFSAPQIEDAIDASSGQLSSASGIRVAVAAMAGLVLAAVSCGRPRLRRRSILFGAILSSLALFGASVTPNLVGMYAAQIAAGAGLGALVLYPAVVMDGYPPTVRFRALSTMFAVQVGGLAIAALLVSVLTGGLDLSWRVAVAVLASLSVCSVAVAACARNFPDTDADSKTLLAMVESSTDQGAAHPRAMTGRPRVNEVLRHISTVPTARRMLSGAVLLGMSSIPLPYHIFDFLREERQVGGTERGVVFAGVCLMASLGLIAVSRRGERSFHKDPAGLLKLGCAVLMAGMAALCLATGVPVYALTVIAFGVALALVAAMAPISTLSLMSVLPPGMRTHALAIMNALFWVVGGACGIAFVDGMARRFDLFGVCVALVLPAVGAVYFLRQASLSINGDLDRAVDTVVEDAEVQILRSSGAHLPMIRCQKIDFSYGQLQVLFNVDFTVDDGEMVALLGTNGAGKSTLLRVISGLGRPSRGIVRFRGVDITTVDAQRRVPMGISQVPGGRGVFGNLTVAENLRLIGYTHGRNRSKLEAGIDETFSCFPRLAERRNQLASTLSGGEQQMLALSKAYILEPRLLLIDELSLGLAPKIVSELLTMVRRINARGTAIVLVEQSVNIALSLVQHAYFMEKGEIRFDGRAEDLLERGDLLRSVFLKGAAGGLAETETVNLETTTIGGPR
ncbi:MFS transporter [Nocardia sp. NBC_00508]|uniref:MFS transporter n=1 Tax=Nocardia sp. NBC_00508 TaxID=2975992 RepID=UPI002E81E9D9|nr:MFS transporter [Nocardia sp. NBC_00508]WUD67106.1 MFS transporter [Nocardia sp. NBC_00508]